MHKVLLLHLLLLHLLCLPPHLVFELSPLRLHIRLVLLLHREVHRLSHRLLLFLLTLERVPLRLLVHVSLARHQNVCRALLGLVKLLPSLNIKLSRKWYFLFFLLKQGNAVRKQFVIFLSTLSSDLGRDELAMKSLIVVLLIDIKIHLGCGWVLRTVQLIVQVSIFFLFLLIYALLLLLLLLSLIEVLLILLVLKKIISSCSQLTIISKILNYYYYYISYS